MEGGTAGVWAWGRWGSEEAFSATCAAAGADRGFAAAGAFFRLAEAPPSFEGSLFSTFFSILCFSLALFRSLHPPESSPLSPLLPRAAPPFPLPACRRLPCARSSLHSTWYRSSVATATRSSCCSRASRVGRSLLREASVSARSLQPAFPIAAPGLVFRPRPRPGPRLTPGASVKLQGLEEAGRHEASEPASMLSGVGGDSGASSGGRHRERQSLVEEEREGGSSIPSNRTL